MALVDLKHIDSAFLDQMGYEILPLIERQKIVREVIDKFLIPRFKELQMNASGEWIENVEAVGEKIRGRDYTEYLVRGRRPNQNQDPKALRAWAYYFGMTVFADWVRNKGLDLNPIAVAYNVAKNGTTWLHKGGSDLLDILKSDEVREYIESRAGVIVLSNITVAIDRYLYTQLNNNQ